MPADDPRAPDATRLMAALDATWPAARVTEAGGWLLRQGAGGGKRVSAASPAGPDARNDGAIADAEAAMRAWGQTPLFRLEPEDAALDARLDARGLALLDPVVLYAAPVARLAGRGSHVATVVRSAFALAVMEDIWAAGGIGEGRLAVMARARGPSMRLLARAGDAPCGAAFVAVDGEVAMVHAVEVLGSRRRRGAGRLLIEGAARFAADAGADWLALAVLEANAPARALWEGLGMAALARYHYRIAPDAERKPE